MAEECTDANTDLFISDSDENDDAYDEQGDDVDYDENKKGDNELIPIEFDDVLHAPKIEDLWVMRPRVYSYLSLALQIYLKYFSCQSFQKNRLIGYVLTVEEPWPFFAVSYMSRDDPPVALDHTMTWDEFFPKLACIRLRNFSDEEYIARHPFLTRIKFDTVPRSELENPSVVRVLLNGYPRLVEEIFLEYLRSKNYRNEFPGFVPTIGKPWPCYKAVYSSNDNPPVALDYSIAWEDFHPRLALIRLQDDIAEEAGTDNEHQQQQHTEEESRVQRVDADGTSEEHGKENADNVYGSADDNGEDARGEDLLPDVDKDDEDQQQEHTEKDK